MSKYWIGIGPLAVLAAFSFGCGGADDGPTNATEVGGASPAIAGIWIDQDEEVWELNTDGTFSDYDDEDGVWELEGGAITFAYDEECFCSEFDLNGTLISDYEIELDDFQGVEWSLTKSQSR